MSQTIRDVVIRIAVEQKAATIKAPLAAPSVSGVSGAVDKATAASVAAVEQRTDKEIALIQKTLDAEERRHQQATKAAEKAYDKEANEAVAAYSRIMRARESAAEEEKALATQTASTQSAVIAAYSSGAMAALQMAKGIAFVVAANDEQAESFVRAIAKAQGYFDLMVGGAHVVQQLNNAHRQSIVLMNLHAVSSAKAASGGSAVAAGATAAAGGVAILTKAAVGAVGILSGVATILATTVAGPIVAVLAVANVAVRMWNQNTEKETKKAADATERSTQRQISSMERLTAHQQEVMAVKSGRLEANDSEGASALIDEQKAYTEGLRQQGKAIPMKLDTRENEKASHENILKVKNQIVDSTRQEQQYHEQRITALKSEQSVAQGILRTAQDALAVEEGRNRTENARLGLMTASDQRTAKRLLEKTGRGEELNIRDARKAQQLGILKDQTEAAGVKEAERKGLTGARERAGETRPLEQAQRNVKSAENTAGERLKELEKELAEASKQQKELADKLISSIKSKFATTEALERVITGIEERDVARSNQTTYQRFTQGKIQ